MIIIKNFLFTTVFLCLFCTLQAQTSIGIKAGINNAFLGGDDVSDDAKSLVGIQFGVAAEIKITEMLAFQPEILFLQKGNKIETEALDMKFTSKSFLNYVEVPLLLKFMFPISDAHFFATAGPSIGYGLNGKIKNSSGKDSDIDFDNLNRTDISLSVGLGVQFPVGPGLIMFDVRYLNGFSKINDDSINLEVKNRGVGLTAGFLYGLGG